VIQPKAVRQTFPPVPASMAASRKTLTGAVKVVIGADGRVKSASIETPVHPQYDLSLLAAARSWLYSPATINGMPTEVERIIQVKVNAQ
jgi:TonB family protein